VPNIFTAGLHKQAATSASGARTKEAFYSGATRPWRPRALFELRKRIKSRVANCATYRTRPNRAYNARMNVETHIAGTHRGGAPSRLSRNNYVARTGPNSGNARGAGAPKGNRNAMKHGRYAAERKSPRVVRSRARYRQSDRRDGGRRCARRRA